MALVPSLDSVGSSVAAAAVALLVVLLDVLLLDVGVLVAIDVVAEVKDVVDIPLPRIPLDEEDVVTEMLAIVEGAADVSTGGEGSLNSDVEEAKVVKGVAGTLREDSGT